MRLLLPPSRTTSVAERAKRGEAPAPAPIDHYTGTLYKALGAASWTAAERRWALAHLFIHDKDAGIVAAGSWLPLPPAEEPAQPASRNQPLTIDARSKEYVRLIPAPPNAWSLRVVSEDSDGRRLAISHWNKHHKGVLAAALVRDRPPVRRIGDLLRWAAGTGIRLEVVGGHAIDLLV